MAAMCDGGDDAGMRNDAGTSGAEAASSTRRRSLWRASAVRALRRPPRWWVALLQMGGRRDRRCLPQSAASQRRCSARWV